MEILCLSRLSLILLADAGTILNEVNLTIVLACVVHYLRIWKHRNNSVDIFSNLLDISKEFNVVFCNLCFFGMIDIGCKNLESFFGEVDGHWQSHIAETNEPDFGAEPISISLSEVKHKAII